MTCAVSRHPLSSCNRPDPGASPTEMYCFFRKCLASTTVLKLTACQHMYVHLVTLQLLTDHILCVGNTRADVFALRELTFW